MKNKRNTLRIAFLLLVLCMISTVMLSGTFAKYTSEYAGQDTALVARWNFEATDGTTSLGEANQQLDLFSHAYDEYINEKAGEHYIIAPGVEGEFTIAMSFLSDVDAKVTVDFDKEGSTVNDAVYNLPIVYSVEENKWVELDGLANAFVEALTDNYDITVKDNVYNNSFTFNKSDVEANEATAISQTVKWRWAFDDSAITGKSDKSDTLLGNASAQAEERLQYILNVNIKAEQIAPTTDQVEDD